MMESAEGVITFITMRAGRASSVTTASKFPPPAFHLIFEPAAGHDESCSVIFTPPIHHADKPSAERMRAQEAAEETLQSAEEDAVFFIVTFLSYAAILIFNGRTCLQVGRVV